MAGGGKDGNYFPLRLASLEILQGLFRHNVGSQAGGRLSDILEEIMHYVLNRRQEYAAIARDSNRRGMEIKKLSAECRELAYFDVMKEIERIRAAKQEMGAE